MRSKQATLWLVTDIDTRMIVGTGVSRNQNLKWMKTSDDRQPLGKPGERYDIDKTAADIELVSSSENGV